MPLVLSVFITTSKAFAAPDESVRDVPRDQGSGSEPVPSRDVRSARPGAAAPDKERAKQLYEEGLKAYGERRYSDAIDALLASADVYPSPMLYYNISLVYEAMGDTASALAWVRRYARESGETTDQEATLRISELEKRLQHEGVQQVSVFSAPDGGLVDIDGRGIGVAPVTAQLVPGKHLLTVTLAGYAPGKSTIELRADKSMDVRVELSPERSLLPSSAEPVHGRVEPTVRDAHAASAPRDERGSRVSVLAVGALGAGIGALGASLAFEILRADSEAAARNASQVDYAARVREMDSERTWSRVFLGVGATLVVAGGIKLGFDLGERKQSRPSAALGGCGHAGVCGTARGEF
jgi:tetratricopeptide (TPR) repeat protein